MRDAWRSADPATGTVHIYTASNGNMDIGIDINMTGLSNLFETSLNNNLAKTFWVITCCKQHVV